MKTEKELTHIADNIQLSHTEKAVMFASIMSPATSSTPTPAPKKRFFTLTSPYQHFLEAGIAVCFICVISVSAAAEQSLPGNILYALKVNVNEKILEGTAFTDESEAEAHISISKRRIDEIEKSAKLQQTKNEDLQAARDSLAEHTTKAFESIERVSKEKGGEAKAFTLTKQFNDVLDSYISKNKDNADEKENDEDTVKEEKNEEEVNSSNNETNEEEVRDQNMNDDQDEDEKENEEDKKNEEIEETLNEVRKIIDSNKKSVKDSLGKYLTPHN